MYFLLTLRQCSKCCNSWGFSLSWGGLLQFGLVESWQTPLPKIFFHHNLCFSTYLQSLSELPSLEEHSLNLKLGLISKMIVAIHANIPSFCDNIHRRADHAFQFELPFVHPIFLTQCQFGILLDGECYL